MKALPSGVWAGCGRRFAWRRRRARHGSRIRYGSRGCLGTREAKISHPLGELLVDPLLLHFQVPLDPVGAARIPIIFPSGPGAVGAEYTAQAVVVDSGASNGISHTNGLRMHVGAKVQLYQLVHAYPVLCDYGVVLVSRLSPVS